MGKIFLLFFHELRILLKDRQALGLLFAMPLAFILFLTFALQDVYLSKVGKNTVLNVAARSCTSEEELCARIVKELRKYQYQILLAEELPTKKVEIALLMPKDLDETISRLQANQPLKDEERIRLLFDPALDQSARALVQSNLSLAIQTVLINGFQKELKNAKREGEELKVPTVASFDGLVKEEAFGGVVIPNPIQQTVPAWALFGMFFILIPLSNSMIRDRRLGIFKRLLSFPVSPAQLVLGKVLAFFVINLLQFALMFTVGVFLLPFLTHLPLALDFSLVGVLVITIVSALAATGYGMLVSSLARTPEQASAFGALSVVILAIMGGVMIPTFIMPEFMQTLSRFSPLYWALEAYHDLILRKLPLADAGFKIAVLAGFAFVCACVSIWRFRWDEVG